MGNVSKNLKRYGWRPDLPDHRDHMYAAPPHIMCALPAKVDLKPQCPVLIYDQGQLGSCTANAIGAAIEFDRLKQGLPDFMPSRLFIYYNERDMEGTVNSDAGAMIRDGIKVVNQFGAPPETEWPYLESQFTSRPTASTYESAKQHQAVSYQNVLQSLNQLKGCLAAGYPFIFGITIYEGFESDTVAQTGQVQMPAQSEGCLGGHAILCVGYDDTTQRFTIRNSWGPGWGDGGYFTLPYSYVTSPDLADDFWTIRLVK